MESAIALERLLSSCRATRCSGIAFERVHMQNVAGWYTVPVKVLR